MFAKLLLSVIRDERNYRSNSSHRARADAEFSAVKPKVMEALKYKCAFCGHVSMKFNECHHIDGNHANNEKSNFAAADTLCHAYQHIGQRASQERFASHNLGDKTVIAAVPEISASDLNLLQRAIGTAMLDESEILIAKKIHKLLSDRAKPVKDAFGTFEVGDFGAAMANMDNEAYLNRDHVIEDLRLIFHVDVLKNEGQKFIKDFVALPFKSWEDVSKNAFN